jgi:hypothetical protein
MPRTPTASKANSRTVFSRAQTKRRGFLPAVRLLIIRFYSQQAAPVAQHAPPSQQAAALVCESALTLVNEPITNMTNAAAIIEIFFITSTSESMCISEVQRTFALNQK